MKEMKTLKFPGQDEPYEIVDAKARDEKQDKLTGATGQVVGFDASGDAFAQDLSTIATALGAAKVQAGSYKGTGKSGNGSKNSLTFSFVPKLVIICGNADNVVGLGVWVNGNSQLVGGSNYHSVASFSNKTLAWYYSNSGQQLNNSGTTYYWIAIG